MIALAADAVTAVLQLLAFGGVVGDRAFIGRHGFLATAELVEQVGSGGSGRRQRRAS